MPPRSDIVVREFEPDSHDNSKLNRVEPNEEVTEEMADARMELMKLEQELSIMRQGPFGPQSEFMQSLAKDEREQLLQALAKEGVLQGEQEDLLTMAELERLSQEDEDPSEPTSKKLGITLRIPKKDQAYIRHFNKTLQEASDAEGVDVQKNLNLWRWYLRCQQQVHDFSTVVSQDVWHFLWDSQSELKARPRHLVVLAQDILEAKKTLEPKQWLSYIEALHNTGETENALRIWHDQKSDLRSDVEVVSTYWALGVQMYAATSQPLKAQELAFNALSGGKAHPQILVPVITAWSRDETPDALVKAWSCYLKLKEKAGNSMLPEIYERISNAFLDTDHGDMALGVFKDMLLMKADSEQDSMQVYKKATAHFGEVLRSATTEEQINRVGLSTLLILPRRFQNRFFFTSWIKKLIGEKRTNSASMVVELMYERGVAPDAKPLNGIIGAWLREGTANTQRKAQDMAWSMIEARAELVRSRSTTSESEGKSYRSVIAKDEPQSIQRRIPAATIETFSILLQHYTRRQDVIEAEKLTSTMVDSCQIQPNSYIMNHWLFGDLRAGRLQSVWDKYCNLKVDIAPDLETFAALWDTAKVNLSRTDPTHAKYFPSARVLFGEMKAWISSLRSAKARIAKEEFSAELYEQVIRCFCLATDLPGTLLAMHHMARIFDFYPTDNALRLVCGQAARLLPPEERINTRSPRNRRVPARHKSVMTQVADIIETIETKRKIALFDQGFDVETLEDPESQVAQQLRLAVLTEFMCMFMQKTQSETGSYRNDIKIAAETMHVDFDGIDLNFSD